MTRSPRRADAVHPQALRRSRASGAILLVLALGLSGWLGHVAAQRTERQPIATTPPATPRLPEASPPPAANIDLSNRPVIATTQPPAPPVPPPPVRPVRAWPERKEPPPPSAGGTRPAPPVSAPAIRGAALSLEKTGPPAVEPGKPLAYEIVVRSVGAAPAHQVRVDDALPEGVRYLGGEPTAETAENGLTWKLGTLEVGAERRLRVEVQAEGGADLASRGAAAAFSTSSQAPTRVGKPELTLTVTGPESVAVGEPVVLQMKLSNTGTAPAANVVLHDRLPAGLKHAAGEELETELGTLAPGESKTFALKAVAAQPGRHINQATASAEGAAPAAAHTPVAVREPALLLEVADLTDPLPVGAETTYEIRVLNPADAALSALRVTATIPDGLALLNADGPAAHRCEGQRVTFEPLPLDARADLLYRVRVKGKEPGEWRLRVELTADQLAGPVSKEESTRVDKE